MRRLAGNVVFRWHRLEIKWGHVYRLLSSIYNISKFEPLKAIDEIGLYGLKSTQAVLVGFKSKLISIA